MRGPGLTCLLELLPGFFVDKMKMTFESTDLPEEKKVKMAVTFLDNVP